MNGIVCVDSGVYCCECDVSVACYAFGEVFGAEDRVFGDHGWVWGCYFGEFVVLEMGWMAC